jgi:hypothetical protein
MVILNLIINVLLMAFAIFSVIELIYSKSTSGSFLHRISKRGWLLIIFAALSILFNLFKDLDSSRKQAKSEQEKAKANSMLQASQSKILELQISTKDSIIKAVNNTYTNSIKASNEALAKYNLNITDSLHAVVSKLKLDAVHPQLSVAPFDVGKQPVFLTKDKDQNIFNIQFVSSGGTCYKIILDYYILKEVNNQYVILQSGRMLFGDKFITDDIVTTCFINIPPEFLTYPEMIIFITGTFSKDPEGISSVPFNNTFKFNFKDNKYSQWDTEYKKLKNKIINFDQ